MAVVLLTALPHPKCLCAPIKPNQSPPNGVLRRSFPLPFLSLNPLPPRLPSSLKLSAHGADQVAHDFSPVMKVYRDGRVERLAGLRTVPPGIDSVTGVESKDVVISEDEPISARIYLPRLTNQGQKFPLLVYFHGGDFCIETAFSPTYHNVLNSLISQANAVCVSVNYRNAPEHPVPTCHEDSWTAVKWVASHLAGNGSDEWLHRHTDSRKVIFAGFINGSSLPYSLLHRNFHIRSNFSEYAP